MNLEALAVDVIRPALEKANLRWHGRHAFRRGLATNLHRLGVSDKVIQQISASRKRHHNDEYLREDGESRRSKRYEEP